MRPNDRMNLTKPAQAMELRRLSWCYAHKGQRMTQAGASNGT